MGKAKKGKRTDKDDDFDSDVEVNDTITDEPVKSKKSKEKKKKGDDVDDLADDIKDLKVDKSKGSKKDKKSKKKGGDDSDDDMPAPKGKADSGSDSEDDAPKGKKNRKNQPPKKGFAALSIESDNDESEDEKPKSKAKGKKGKKVDSDDDEDEVKTSKSKNKKKNKKAVESDDEDSENDTRKAKGKGKKGKKAVDSEASDDEEVKVKAKNKSNAKKNKKKESDDESEDEVPKPKGKTKDKKGRKASESDEEFQVPTKPVKAVTPKAPKASFALLNMDDDDDVDQDDDAPSPPPSDDESEKTQSIDRSKSAKQSKAQESQKESKKGKKAKKKKQDSDEDIDKVLAELEMEYSGQKKQEAKVETAEQPATEEETAKKGKKSKDVEPEQADAAGDGEEGGTVKTAAQKKKEKKEREKQKKLAQKKAEAAKKTDAPKEAAADADAAAEKPPEKSEEDKTEAGNVEGEGEDGKKKKKKGATEEVPAKEKTKGPGKKMIAAMQEALKKAKEEEERIKREAEEKLRQEEELERLRLEKLQKEQEKKEKKKLKEKQRKEKLKAEGKFLTAKQKLDKARAQAMIEALKAQGLDLPEVGQKAPRPGTRVKPGKLKQQTSAEAKEEAKKPEEEAKEAEQVQVEIVDKQEKPEVKKEDEEDSVKDAWDAETSEEEAEEDKSEETPKESTSENAKKGSKATEKESTPEEEDESSDDSDSESEGSDSESEDDSDEDSEGDGKKTDAERRREKVLQRIQNRRTEAEKKRTTDDLRAAVVCVLGHVDTGKTKILDKLRRTNVQDGEAGGITQQIGATNVPIEAIQESTKLVKGFAEKLLKLPGLLIIDTPGHESFSNLRNRGSSLCDIAILVVDIMHGLEPQTIESIELLKKKKCPFVVALNKIDRLFDWESMGRKDVCDIIAAQGQMTKQEFDKRSKEVILQFAEKVGLNAALFYENPDPRSYVSLVPTSAITGEGMGNLLALIVDACQGPLAKRLMYSEELQATVLEVKALPGLGTTIDCILVNGMLREGDTMIVAGTEGPIVTQIRSLLMPQPLKELRVKNAYVEHREVKAAQGVKIAAKELEKAIAGLNLLVAQKPDEVEIMKEEIARELKQALSKIKLAERGVFVQASTLGALEALLEFLKDSKIPYAGIRIGPVVKKDVMKASIMLEHDVVYATILAFDVKIERDAQELADTLGVKIFQADIIYHLFDRFTEYKEQLKQRKRDEFKHIAVFPCKLKVLPQFVFKSRDPIVMGVMVEAGIVKEGTPICVPSKEFVDLGVVTSIECNHKQVETARKGQEVCIKIEPIPGEAPKMYGRHFEEKDMLVSKISRQSIDACKDYFRDDLMKSDWTLMVELKKLFQIL